MTSHARKNAARRQALLTGVNHRAALQNIRNTLPPATSGPSPARTSPVPAGPANAVVPVELIALVQNFARWGRRHLDEATSAARGNTHHPQEWHRLVLYALTDALAYNFLLVGTLAGYLQQQGVDADLLRRHLQSPDAERYVSQEALDLLAGLMGGPVAEGQSMPTWHFVGQQIAEATVVDFPN